MLQLDGKVPEILRSSKNTDDATGNPVDHSGGKWRCEGEAATLFASTGGTAIAKAVWDWESHISPQRPPPGLDQLDRLLSPGSLMVRVASS